MARRPVMEDVPESITLAKFKGMKNTVTQERLAPDELEAAINVDIDDAGQVHRRRGYDRKITANFHSAYTADRTYVVKDGVLGILYPNYTFEAIKTGIGADTVVYVTIGEHTYYASRSASGRINPDKTVSAWGAQNSAGTWISPVIVPTDTLGAVAGKLLGAPPFATALAYFNGRIYLANDRVLWATELYQYDYVDKTKNFRYFENEITGLGAVTDGIYVGTSGGCYFLSGQRFDEMRRVRVSEDAVLPGSMTAVPSDFIGLEKAQSNVATMMITTGGACAGLDGGLFYNITEDKFWFPEAINISALFRKQDGVNQYIGVANNGGTPTSNTRIGDYVDAEIRRFQGA